jgi:hypothetical protein
MDEFLRTVAEPYGDLLETKIEKKLRHCILVHWFHSYAGRTILHGTIRPGVWATVVVFLNEVNPRALVSEFGLNAADFSPHDTDNDISRSAHLFVVVVKRQIAIKKSKQFRLHGHAITCLASGAEKTVVPSFTLICTPHL